MTWPCHRTLSLVTDWSLQLHLGLGVLLEGEDFLMEKSLKVLWMPDLLPDQEDLAVKSKPDCGALPPPRAKRLQLASRAKVGRTSHCSLPDVLGVGMLAACPGQQSG